MVPLGQHTREKKTDKHTSETTAVFFILFGDIDPCPVCSQSRSMMITYPPKPTALLKLNVRDSVSNYMRLNAYVQQTEQ